MSAKYSCADCLAFLGFERLFEREGGSIPDYSGMTDGPRTGKVCAPVPERQKPALRAKPGRESPRPTSGRRARWKQAKPGDRLKRRSTTGEPCGFLRTPVPRPLAALAKPARPSRAHGSPRSAARRRPLSNGHFSDFGVSQNRLLGHELFGAGCVVRSRLQRGRIILRLSREALCSFCIWYHNG